MSHICHPSKIEFSISLILQRHYILWSRRFQIVNPKVMVSYINLKFQNLPRKSRLHLPVVTLPITSAELPELPPVTKSAHIRLSERQKPVGEWSGKVMGVLCRNRLYGSFRSIPLQDFSPGRRFRTPSLAFSNCTQQFPIVIFIHIAIAINPVFLFPQSPALVFL